jgi:hypothetical protein
MKLLQEEKSAYDNALKKSFLLNDNPDLGLNYLCQVICEVYTGDDSQQVVKFTDQLRNYVLYNLKVVTHTQLRNIHNGLLNKDAAETARFRSTLDYIVGKNKGNFRDDHSKNDYPLSKYLSFFLLLDTLIKWVCENQQPNFIIQDFVADTLKIHRKYHGDK